MKKLKKIPHFNSISQERKFWEKQDSVDYIDWSKAERVRFAQLSTSTKSISIRLPEGLLSKLKLEARKKDVPYQSYIKMILSDHLDNGYRK